MILEQNYTTQPASKRKDRPLPGKRPEKKMIPGTNLNTREYAGLVDSLISLKKEQRARNKNNSKLFLSIGLFLSMVMVILAFEWKTSDPMEGIALGQVNGEFEEVLEIPPTEQPPPPPPKKVQHPEIIEVPDIEEIKEEIQVDFDIEITDDKAVEEVNYEGFESMEEEVAEEVFTIVESMPQFPGGMPAFLAFLGKNIKYPRKAAQLGVEGRVFVEFIVNKDGTLTDLKVVKGIGSGCDEEAIRVLSKAPKWAPGKQRGKAVRVKMVVPIFFKLANA